MYIVINELSTVAVNRHRQIGQAKCSVIVLVGIGVGIGVGVGCLTFRFRLTVFVLVVIIAVAVIIAVVVTVAVVARDDFDGLTDFADFNLGDFGVRFFILVFTLAIGTTLP